MIRILAIGAALTAAPALAQTSPPPQSPAAQHRQGVAQANRRAETMSELQRAAADAQHQADMARWLAEMERRGERIAADRSIYLARQRAYADAMAAWRVQAEACHAGVRAACTLPTPDPADFR